MSGPTVYVAEDEPLAREALTAMVEADPYWTLLGSAASGKVALEACLEEPPDVLLTDIRMPRLTGLELAAALRQERPEVLVVFVTAYDQHALEAFRLAAVDYLLKPISEQDLARCLGRVREAVEQRRAAVRLGALRDRADGLDALLAHPPAFAQRIVVRSPGRIDIVPLEEVIAFRVERNYIDVITAQQTWLHRETLKSLSARIDPRRFVRISRSVLVAVPLVRRVERTTTGGGTVVLEGENAFPVARRFLPGLEAALEA